LQLRHQLARLPPEGFDALGDDRHLLVGQALRQHGKRCLGAAIGIGVAAAVEIRLRQDVGLRRFRDRLGIDQRDLERGFLSFFNSTA
jgi:hypothetical protein